MAPRAVWKGTLKIAEVTCPVSLYTAASTSERISFHTINRKTGNRVQRQFVDEVSGKPVEAEDQVKGYDKGDGDYVILEPEEIAAAIPESDKTLTVETFLPCDEIDDIFFDKPYYVSPSSPVAAEAFALIREGMKGRQSAALARTVIFRRMRSILIRPHGEGLIATTLNFDYEVRSAQDAFSEIPAIKIDDEMLQLAEHIIKTKAGPFDPKQFDDRYESALAELVQAKIEGRKIKPQKRPEPAKVVSLLDALRESAKTGVAAKGGKAAKSYAKKRKAPAEAEPRKKAS
ncbi:Ku protein [Bosea sp. (in: a-proteobacteria)]|uniref:non-homologous end joining protein Ku n=1 Tax=Bosea sp. (in: a-proteobacteria) TaxID=1871050 RepID=UPI002732C062|nr:Ku protein [Bosea sp. (in: a-proteobacteria)]MDP3411525.1 Ku protein [Bosea sp. (in: a-proteobacteria)]